MRKTDDMDPHDQRDPMFDALRADMATQDTPPGVETALLQAFARQCAAPTRPKRRWYQALLSPRWALGGAMALAAVTVTLFTLQAPRPGTLLADSRPLIAGDDGGAPFIALDSVERIEGEPAPRVVETEVARSSLAALGVALTPDNAGDTIKAELLVASDGQALALRLSDAADFKTMTY